MQSRQPKAGIELGMILTLRASVPIYAKANPDKIIGYLELIKLIDDLADTIRENDIEMIALMDRHFLKKASLMREYPTFKSYIIANQNASVDWLKKLQTIDWHTLTNDHMLFEDHNLEISLRYLQQFSKRDRYYL